VARNGLTAQHLASAIQNHGGLVVRGLISPETVARLRSHMPGSGACECMSPDAVLDVISIYSDLGTILESYFGAPPWRCYSG
jgi:hypothetical protein